MSQGNVVGKVTKVTKGKGVVTTKHGSYERINISIEGPNGAVLVQKLVKPGNDGQSLVGKQVSATFTETEVQKADGTTFIGRSVDSKGFVILDATGQPATFGRSAPTSHATPAPAATGTTRPSGTGYNSDGARHGMIVNNAVALAAHRKDLTLQGLKLAAKDVSELTKYVESGTPDVTVTASAPVAPKAKAKPVVVEEEDENLFEDE